MPHKTPVMEEVFLSHVYLKVNLTARRLYIPKKMSWPSPAFINTTPKSQSERERIKHPRERERAEVKRQAPPAPRQAAIVSSPTAMDTWHRKLAG